MDFDEDEEDEEKPKATKFPLCMYITEGVKYFKLRMFDKAINCFNSALEREPTNEKCLLGRSKCFMNKGMYIAALNDAKTALKSNPKSSQAKVLKAEAEYFLGDFEKSFLTFARAHNNRPNYVAFKLGYQSCRRSIDNALRPDEPIHFDDEDVEGIEELLSDKPAVEEDVKRSRGRKRTISYENDIEFLKDLFSDEIEDSLQLECKQLKEFLEERQSFWRYQNPNTSKESGKLMPKIEKK